MPDRKLSEELGLRTSNAIRTRDDTPLSENRPIGFREWLGQNAEGVCWVLAAVLVVAWVVTR